MKQHWETDELIDTWTLPPPERELLGNITPTLFTEYDRQGRSATYHRRQIRQFTPDTQNLLESLLLPEGENTVQEDESRKNNYGEETIRPEKFSLAA